MRIFACNNEMELVVSIPNYSDCGAATGFQPSGDYAARLMSGSFKQIQNTREHSCSMDPSHTWWCPSVNSFKFQPCDQLLAPLL
jgi:hypothetical protein